MRDDYLKLYRELYQQHWWWRAREKFILKTLAALQPPGGWTRILDVGCGDGLFFDQLMPFGEVEGVEASAASVSEHGPYRSRIHICSFDENFQPGKQFTLILMLDVLEHLADPAAALRRALALLAPGGMVLATVPAFNTSVDKSRRHQRACHPLHLPNSPAVGNAGRSGDPGGALLFPVAFPRQARGSHVGTRDGPSASTSTRPSKVDQHSPLSAVPARAKYVGGASMGLRQFANGVGEKV